MWWMRPYSGVYLQGSIFGVTMFSPIPSHGFSVRTCVFVATHRSVIINHRPVSFCSLCLVSARSWLGEFGALTRLDCDRRNIDIRLVTGTSSHMGL